MAKSELRWASFVSGGGTTMQEMARATQIGDVSGVRLELVVASKPGIGAIRKAQELGLEPGQIVVINPNDFKGEDGEVDQDGFGKALLTELKRHSIDFVTQNGWLKKTPPRVIEEFEAYNQHPQRPDLFGGPGMYGVRPHGARLYYANLSYEPRPIDAMPVVQRVHKEYDKGEVVLYEAVPVPVEVTSESMIFAAPSLQKVVLPHEHTLNIELLRQMRSGTVRAQELPPMPVPIFRSTEDLAEASRNMAIATFPQP
jgi:phosphoribosylglycinamide formyltransferase 1